ncbi:MAG TPA: hypothetical protein VFU47_07400, partial [Armatimonadota bacterium]|nr:hypothetical protein [Armatimonadota bacterium]
MLAAAAVALGGLAARPAFAGGMSDDLARQANAYPNSRASKRVIVQLDRNVDLSVLAQSVGGRLGRRLQSVNGVSLELPYGQLKKLARLSGV